MLIVMVRLRNVLTGRSRPGVSQHTAPRRAARHNGKVQWGRAGGGPVANGDAGGGALDLIPALYEKAQVPE